MVLKSPENRCRSYKSEIVKVSAPAILISSIFFLFGPVTIYSGNISEFQVKLVNILKYFPIPSILLVAFFLIIGLLLPKKTSSVFVSIIVGVAALFWIQGNFFVWQGGPIGITDIDWADHAWRGWLDGILWFALLSVVCLFHKALYEISVPISIILISIQMAYVAFLSFQNPELWKRSHELTTSVSPPQKVFQFSSKFNAIHIILDEFQSTVFRDLVDQDPEHYENALDGFTFFQEATGSFPTTIMSIPVILGGMTYYNDVPINTFIESAYKGNTIITALARNGYEVDLMAPWFWPTQAENLISYKISVPYGLSKIQHEKAAAATMLNLVLFRYAPHFIKRIILNRQIRLPDFNFTKESIEYQQGARHLAHRAFLQDFIDKISIDRDRPLYKFIHLTTTHWPAVLNSDCEYAGKILPWTWENVRVQAKCGFDHFLEFLNSLKTLGIYDSSFIILQADHGYWKVPDSVKQVDLQDEQIHLDGYFSDDKEYFAQIVCSALPLLAIKMPNSEGPLKTSKAEVMLSDIPATINSVLNLDEKFSGRSVFDVGATERRKRSFHYHDRLNSPGDDYFGRMDEFIIDGNALDKTSWKFVKYLSPSEDDHHVDKLDLGTNGGNRFLGDGWSHNEGTSSDGLTFQWALGHSASVILSLEKGKSIRLTANMKTFVKDQQVTVKVDGKEIGKWCISPNWNWEKHSVIVDADNNRPNVSVVEFQFSQFKKPEGKDPRPLAVLFESITLEKLGSAE